MWAWVHDALCRWIWPRAHSCGRVAGGGERRRVLELCARWCVRWGILAGHIVGIGGYRTGVTETIGFLFCTARASGRAAEHRTLKTRKLPRGAGRAIYLLRVLPRASGAHYHPFYFLRRRFHFFPRPIRTRRPPPLCGDRSQTDRIWSNRARASNNG